MLIVSYSDTAAFKYTVARRAELRSVLGVPAPSPLVFQGAVE